MIGGGGSAEDFHDVGRGSASALDVTSTIFGGGSADIVVEEKRFPADRVRKLAVRIEVNLHKSDIFIDSVEN